MKNNTCGINVILHLWLHKFTSLGDIFLNIETCFCSSFCQTKKKQTTESPFDKTRGLELLHSCFVKISVLEHACSPSPQCLCLTQFSCSHISFIFAANPAF